MSWLWQLIDSLPPSYVQFSAIAGRVTRSALKPAAQESAAKRAIQSVKFQRFESHIIGGHSWDCCHRDLSYVHLLTKTIAGIVMLYHLWLEDAFALSPETKSSKYQIDLSSLLLGGRMESQWVPRVRSKAEDRSFPSAKTFSVQCSYKIKITKRHMLMILLAKSCL